MKALLINGSPHAAGCTFTALSEVAKTLEANGVATVARMESAADSAGWKFQLKVFIR